MSDSTFALLRWIEGLEKEAIAKGAALRVHLLRATAVSDALSEALEAIKRGTRARKGEFDGEVWLPKVDVDDVVRWESKLSGNGTGQGHHRTPILWRGRVAEAIEAIEKSLREAVASERFECANDGWMALTKACASLRFDLPLNTSMCSGEHAFLSACSVAVLAVRFMVECCDV
jgi:hypothetical protein